MTTVNTIGTTGRDYSTLQAWEDAVPATPTGGYEGHCYNDSQFTAKLIIAGHTTSAANYILLTAATGQSFQDHASVRTNPLFYDQSKGVGLAANPFADHLLTITNDYVNVSRMQIKRTAQSYTTTRVLEITTGGTALTNFIKDCIIAKAYNGTNTVMSLREQRMANCLVYDSGTGASALVVCQNTAHITSCTLAHTGSAAGTGVSATYASPLVTNTAVFNNTTAFSGSYNASSGYNCTDAASAAGSNNQVSKTFANQFQNTASDYRLKAGSDCIDLGFSNATYAPNDISGTVRGLTTAGDIGAWEVVASGIAHLFTGKLASLLIGKFG